MRLIKFIKDIKYTIFCPNCANKITYNVLQLMLYKKKLILNEEIKRYSKLHYLFAISKLISKMARLFFIFTT